jgi:hypothetical protein
MSPTANVAEVRHIYPHTINDELRAVLACRSIADVYLTMGAAR